MTNEPDDLTSSAVPDPLLADISAKTLQMVDAAAENFRRGIVGPPVDPERLKRLAS